MWGVCGSCQASSAATCCRRAAIDALTHAETGTTAAEGPAGYPSAQRGATRIVWHNTGLLNTLLRPLWWLQEEEEGAREQTDIKLKKTELFPPSSSSLVILMITLISYNILFFPPFFRGEIASLLLKRNPVRRSDPGARRGWLKNKLISGPIDGGQAGKYHGKLNYRDSREQRYWPVLINSM